MPVYNDVCPSLPTTQRPLQSVTSDTLTKNLIGLPGVAIGSSCHRPLRCLAKSPVAAVLVLDRIHYSCSTGTCISGTFGVYPFLSLQGTVPGIVSDYFLIVLEPISRVFLFLTPFPAWRVPEIC